MDFKALFEQLERNLTRAIDEKLLVQQKLTEKLISQKVLIFSRQSDVHPRRPKSPTAAPRRAKKLVTEEPPETVRPSSSRSYFKIKPDYKPTSNTTESYALTKKLRKLNQPRPQSAKAFKHRRAPADLHDIYEDQDADSEDSSYIQEGLPCSPKASSPPRRHKGPIKA